MKKPKLKRDWIGRRVRALRALSNGNLTVPPGKILTVARNWKGLELVSDPCPHCGVKIRITRVSVHSVELLPILYETEFKGPRC